MKDYPQNTQEWADEAYQAMTLAWDELTKTNPFPTENKKTSLIETAALMACENRDITDATFIAHAKAHANDQFKDDYDNRDVVLEVNYSLCFLLAYFDAHLSLSMIEQKTTDEAIAILRSNYDLSYTGKDQTSALSINYSTKI